VMTMNILITGVQNAIEESIVKLALERIEGKARFSILSFTDFVDTEESPADELMLMKDTQKKIKKNIQMKVLKSRTGDHIIVSGYFTVKSRLGFYPVITKEVLEVLKPDFLVHISVDPLSLSGKIDSAEVFEEHQAVERACALFLGANTGCGVRIIRSGVDGSRAAADELYGMLKDLLVKK
jgi:adenylate kinase